MALDVETVKLSLRIDTDDDDPLLELFMNTASDYIKNGVGNKVENFYEKNSLFDTGVLLLTDHYYRNRSASVDTNNKSQVVEIPLGVNPIILQLKARYLCQLQELANSTSE